MSDRKYINWREEKDSIIFLYERGYSQLDISKMYGVAQSTVGNQMIKLRIPTNPRIKRHNNCSCGASIKLDSKNCMSCSCVKREDKRKGKPKPFLTDFQKCIQSAICSVAPDYYGEIRVEELIC